MGITDPDGDALHWAIQGAIGAASGVLSNGLGNLSSGRDFFDGAGKAAAWGAVSAFASFGIGEVFKGAAASVSTELWRGYAHALVQGNISRLQGGDFLTGAASGAIGSGISSGIGALKGGSIEQILGGGLGGGIGSAISGGNFWQGFGIGVAVGALNHGVHEYLYDWKSPNKYKILDQGIDPTCVLACGANILKTDIATVRKEFEAAHGPISKDGTQLNKFIEFMDSKGYNNLVGPDYKSIFMLNIGENLKNGYHTMATYPESGGNHSVLVTRIRITKQALVKMTYNNSQNGGSIQTSTFPISELTVLQFWKR